MNKFIQDCINVVGEKNVNFDVNIIKNTINSVSGELRRVLGIINVFSTSDVEKIIHLANTHRVSLHPISTGKNWGLGSALPVTDDVFILNLKGMNKIREVNVEYGYALIEPGVTQKQLYDYLVEHDLPFIVDVTGSGRDTSIIANVIECGVGYYALRNDLACGFEVVLGNGSLLRTGYAHFDQATTKYLYKYGVGPQIDGLFIQSNFGIITALAVDLIRKKPYSVALTCTIRDEKKLSEFIDSMAELKRSGVISNIIKIGNRNRSYFTILPVAYNRLHSRHRKRSDIRQKIDHLLSLLYGPWSAVVGISGTKRQVKSTIFEVRRQLNRDIHVRILSDKRIKILKSLAGFFRFIPTVYYLRVLLDSMIPLYNLTKGIPTNQTLPSLYWPLGSIPDNFYDPDNTKAGMIAFLPIVPLDGKTAINFVSIVKTIFHKYHFSPAITLNVISNKAMWGVIDLSFDRTNAPDVVAAKKAIFELYEASIKVGIFPQRVGIDYMGTIVDSGDPYWGYISKLKKVFDPNNIISPRRYSID